MVLGYSRKAYSEAVLRQDTETFLRCLENGLRAFCGVPLLLNLNNLKAAVLKADWFDPEINPKLADFCRHYGLHVMPCRPCKPQHKGKVEQGVSYRDQALLDRARREANTKRAKLDRKRRQHLVERSFADAANRHGFKRARWRGLIKQSIQDLLIATIQNLRKLVKTTQNLPGKAWEAVTRILSWSAVTLHTLFTSSPPRHLALALS